MQPIRERNGKIIPVIHRDARFNRCLRSLKRAGGKAARAADCAEAIIKRLSYKAGSLGEMGKLTRHGEARIKNCVKYDLGSGYRLLCLKTRKYLILLFAGTHDDSDRWIENNRESLWAIGDSILRAGDGNTLRAIEGTTLRANDGNLKKITAKGRSIPRSDGKTEEQEPGCDYDDILLEKITERDLRWIFSGLCR